MDSRQHFVGDRVVVYRNGRYPAMREGVIVEELMRHAMSARTVPSKWCFKYRIWFPRVGVRTIVDGHDGYTVCNPKDNPWKLL